MDEDRTLAILKNAILLEKRGKSFYATVADQTDKDAVRQFFKQMATEEDSHIRILSEQFKSYNDTKSFKSSAFETEHSANFATDIINAAFKEQVAAADFEAAAIAAAMAMEKNAITLYSRRAKEAQDDNEKALYRWLADWEKSHLEFLAAIDRELTEKVWHDNNFWPF
jgi:rubrerythrin